MELDGLNPSLSNSSASLNSSRLVSNDSIPIIIIHTGQFTVVDGFVIHLKSKPFLINDLSSKYAKEVLTPGGWYLLRNAYNPNLYKTIKFIKSNFYISKNESLFHIMKLSVVYVKFVKMFGHFSCKKTTKSDATHKAIPLTIERVNNNTIKYLVSDKSIKSLSFDPEDLITQQAADITVMNSIINDSVTTVLDKGLSIEEYKNLKGFELPDVFFVPISLINKIKCYPISQENIKTLLQKEENKRTSQLNKLQDELYNIMKGYNESKFDEIRTYFYTNPEEFNIENSIFEEICNRCSEICRNNLKVLSFRVLPTLVKKWLQLTTQQENKFKIISESYCIIDRFLVSINERCIINDKDEELINSLSTAERIKLRYADIFDWNMLKLVSMPMISESVKLFELVNHSPVEFIEDSNGVLWNTFDDAKGVKKTFDTISIDCGEFGWKHIVLKRFVESEINEPSKEEVASVEYIKDIIQRNNFTEDSNQIIMDILEFSSCQKQNLIYTKLFNEVVKMFQKSQLG